MGFEKGKNSNNQSILRLLPKELIKKGFFSGLKIKAIFPDAGCYGSNLCGQHCIIKILQLRIKKKGFLNFHLNGRKIIKKTPSLPSLKPQFLFPVSSAWLLAKN